MIFLVEREEINQKKAHGVDFVVERNELKINNAQLTFCPRG